MVVVVVGVLIALILPLFGVAVAGSRDRPLVTTPQVALPDRVNTDPDSYDVIANIHTTHSYKLQ